MNSKFRYSAQYIFTLKLTAESIDSTTYCNWNLYPSFKMQRIGPVGDEHFDQSFMQPSLEKFPQEELHQTTMVIMVLEFKLFFGTRLLSSLY